MSFTQARRSGAIVQRFGGRRALLLLAALLSSLAGSFAAVRQAALESYAVEQPGAASAEWLVGPGRSVALWVKENTLLTPDGVRAAVATAREIGAGALFVQVLARGEAAYRSSIWPAAWHDQRPAGEFVGGDPLAMAVALAHRSPRIEVHAWVNAYTWGELGANLAGSQHPLARHPEWVTYDEDARSLWTYGPQTRPGVVGALFVDPALAGVQRTMLETIQEIVRRYDVDGVHLDYVRYPWAGAGYHPDSLRAFWQSYEAMSRSGEDETPVTVRLPDAPGSHGVTDARPPKPATQAEKAAWNVFRARQVTALVEKVATFVRQEAPSVRLTAAVQAGAQHAYESFLQEWPDWLQRGLLDGVLLMSYTTSQRTLVSWVEEAKRLSSGAPVFAGIGAYMLAGQPQAVVAQARAAVQAGADGVALFSFETLESEPSMLSALARGTRGGAGPVRSAP